MREIVLWPRITAAQPYWRATRRAAAQMSARASSLLTHPTAPAARAACSIPSSSDALTSSTRHAGARIELAQALEDLEAVDVGHAQVEQHHVGVQALDGVERRLSPVGLADELEPGMDPHRAAHAAAEHRAVVDDQDADGARAAGYLRS